MDLYAVLGVARTSSLDEIRSAYRKLALGLHPDRNPGDKEKERRFKEVSQAYDVLSDEGRRARYDLERGQPGRVPIQPAPFFRGGRGGFTFTPAGMWGTSAGVNVGASVQIRVSPQMAGQTVQVQIGGVPMPGVYVFVRRG